MNTTKMLSMAAAALIATTSLAWADSDKGRKDRYDNDDRYESRNYGQENSRRVRERNEERKEEKRRYRDDDDRRYSRTDVNAVYDRDGRYVGTRQSTGVIIDRNGRPIGTGQPGTQTVFDRDGRPVGTIGVNGTIDPVRAATEAVIGVIAR